MASNYPQSEILYINNATLAYPQLDKPKGFTTNGVESEPVYRASILFSQKDTEQVNNVLAHLKQCIPNYSPNTDLKNNCLRNGDTQMTLNDNNEEVVKEGYAGNYEVYAKQKTDRPRPTLVDENGNIIDFSDLQQIQGKFYGGAKADVAISFWYDPVRKNLCANLLAVKFIGHGEPLGASGNLGAKAAAGFRATVGATAAKEHINLTGEQTETEKAAGGFTKPQGEKVAETTTALA